MKRLLKYMLMALAAIIFWSSMDTSTSADAEDDIVSTMRQEILYHEDITESQAEIYIPRQVSFANPVRSHSSARRTGGAGRHNIEFVKSGKLINASIRYFIQQKAIFVHSPLIEPSHWLLYLGKLII